MFAFPAKKTSTGQAMNQAKLLAQAARLAERDAKMPDQTVNFDDAEHFDQLNQPAQPAKPAQPTKPAKPVKLAYMSPKMLADLVEQTMQTNFVPWKSVTPEQIAEILLVQQHILDANQKKIANPVWLKHRRLQLTGSSIAGIADHDRYNDAISVIRDIVWNVFAKKMEVDHFLARIVNFGTDHEEDAGRATMEFLNSPAGKAFVAEMEPGIQYDQAVMNTYGLVRCEALPMVSASPDGVLSMGKDRLLVEFKCKTCQPRWPLDSDPPASKMYKFERHNNKMMLPMSVKYYAQVMWCNLVMASHTLDSLTSSTSGCQKDRQAFFEWFNKYAQQAKQQGIESFGQGLINHPGIVFACWAPGCQQPAWQQEPQVYDSRDRTRLVRTRYGVIQVSMLRYDQDFAHSLLFSAWHNWYRIYLPAIILKENNALAPNELTVACDMLDGQSTDESDAATTEPESDSDSSTE